VKSWIRIRIEVRIQELQRFKMEPWTLTLEAWKLKMELWMACRRVVAALHHVDERKIRIFALK
jgi:hypothetical protein